MELSFPFLEAAAFERETKPLILVSEAIAPEALGQDDNMVPTIELQVTISKESVGLKGED